MMRARMPIDKWLASRQSRLMRIWRAFGILTVAALLGAGCGSSDKPQPKSAIAPSNPPQASAPATNAAQKIDGPGQPQPKLPTLKLWLGPEELITEIAATDQQVMTGMMFRTEMAENEGMLFVFAPPPRQVSFWMRNTLLPLSCAYIDPEGVILEIHDMQPRDETPIKAASARIQYVLEVKQGWFERHKINVGTAVRTERGTFAETFFRAR
jgi:uncharacterized membrane protein (UPF0127 family)